jgi:hypothetical protein
MKGYLIWAAAVAAALGWVALRGQAADLEPGGTQADELQPRLQTDSHLTLGPPKESDSASDRELGYRFHRGMQEAGFGAEIGFGTGLFGGKATHDMALATFQYGWIFSDVVA